MLGISTGGRISELFSLTIGDVYQNRAAVTDLFFEKSIVKGGEVSRAVPINKDGRESINNLIDWHRQHYGTQTKAVRYFRRDTIQVLFRCTGEITSLLSCKLG